MKLRIILVLCLPLLGVRAAPRSRRGEQVSDCESKRPNFVLMIMDDVGWGDLGVFGNPIKETPNIDKMAAEGTTLLDFYSPSPTCSPSRASMLTGRLPIRNGFFTDNTEGRTAFLYANVLGGISANEVLVSELLMENGYKNKFIGKWHMGHHDQYLPLEHGFHEYFGSTNNHFGPYDNVNVPNVPVFKDDQVIGRFYEGEFNITNEGESNMTKIYLDEALDFIDKSVEDKDPFFLIWAPDSMHQPLYASEKFLGKSNRGRYGDAIMEIDDSVGQILKRLRVRHIERDTFVFFSSDNGGATYNGVNGGINGPFLCGKFTNFEGGQRVPAIARWPGKIKANKVTNQAGNLMDLFDTVLEIAKIEKPENITYDSHSLVSRLIDGKEEDDKPVFFYRGTSLFAVRYGFYKAHNYVWANPEMLNGWEFCAGDYVENITTRETVDYTAQPLLFHLGRDPRENYPINPSSNEYIEMMAKIQPIIDEHVNTMVRGVPEINYWDPAGFPWQPKGCNNTGLCLPSPPSQITKIPWNF